MHTRYEPSAYLTATYQAILPDIGPDTLSKWLFEGQASTTYVTLPTELAYKIAIHAQRDASWAGHNIVDWAWRGISGDLDAHLIGDNATPHNSH